MVLTFLTLLGAVGLFLYGMNLLSNGILKLTGDRFTTWLSLAKKNPISSIASGAGMAAIAESSSAATVAIVSFANAGAITLAQAILMIMGANIGATLTAWFIAVFGFSLGIGTISYPFIALGFVLLMMKGKKRKIAGESILGFAFIFLGMSYMMNNFPAAGEMTGIKAAFDSFTGNGFLTILLFMAAGCILAFACQSTGAITLTMVIASCGWISFDMAAAMVMGENIGTTITANLAASEANLQAKRAALVHTLFNIIGAILILLTFKPFLKMIGLMVTGLGLDNPYLGSLSSGREAVLSGVYGIAIFHTMFNFLNTCVLAWFTKPLERLMTLLVKKQEGTSEEESRLKFISARHFSSPAIGIGQAFKEIAGFGEELGSGFGYVRKALNESDPDKFEEYRMSLVQLEEISDKMEYQIADFLNGLTTEPLTDEEADEVKILYRVIGELESLGDSGENISRILERERVHNRKFDEKAVANINLMIDAVTDAYEVMVENLKTAISGNLNDISNAYEAENRINETRNRLRNEGIDQIGQQTGNYQSLNYFLDIISELEAMGDFMINVSQAVSKRKAS